MENKASPRRWPWILSIVFFSLGAVGLIFGVFLCPIRAASASQDNKMQLTGFIVFPFAWMIASLVFACIAYHDRHRGSLPFIILPIALSLTFGSIDLVTYAFARVISGIPGVMEANAKKRIEYQTFLEDHRGEMMAMFYGEDENGYEDFNGSVFEAFSKLNPVALEEEPSGFAANACLGNPYRSGQSWASFDFESCSFSLSYNRPLSGEEYVQYYSLSESESESFQIAFLSSYHFQKEAKESGLKAAKEKTAYASFVSYLSSLESFSYSYFPDENSSSYYHYKTDDGKLLSLLKTFSFEESDKQYEERPSESPYCLFVNRMGHKPSPLYLSLSRYSNEFAITSSYTDSLQNEGYYTQVYSLSEEQKTQILHVVTEESLPTSSAIE